ncbi:MAG: c-type cytochrome [Lacipirellulaceae bacterium]
MTRLLRIIFLLPIGLLSAAGCSQPEGTEADTGATEMPALPAKFTAGKAVYDAGCASCHDSSRDGAPRLGYKPAWSRRFSQGDELLIQHAIEGFKLMPPKGDNPELTDEEIADAVSYIKYRAELGIPAKAE